MNRQSYIVIKYRVHAPVHDLGAGWEYALVKGVVGTRIVRTDAAYHLQGWVIGREEAHRIIADEGLVESHRDRDGIVWDTPDREFQAIFGKGRTHIEWNESGPFKNVYLRTSTL